MTNCLENVLVDNLTPSEDIRNRLLVARLPSPPQTLLKLLALCQSDDVGMAELSGLISQDPAMAAKVLSVAHSAAYHRADAQSLTLLQAASTLGTSLIKVLVISESVLQTFNAFTQNGGTDLRYFWKHSLSVALIARELALRQDDANAEDAYLAGLLHDVGRLALLVVAPEINHVLFNEPDSDTLCEQEQLRLGISHTEAGAWLLGQWGLSELMIDGVRHHHAQASSLVDAQPVTRIIHLAHRLATQPLLNVEDAALFDDEPGLTAQDILALVQKARLAVQRVANDLGIDISVEEPAPAEAVASPAQPVDTVQTQLARDVLDRSMLNEMAITLISLGDTRMAMTSLRQHASALFRLDDSLVMVLRDNPQMLVTASMSRRHRNIGPLSFGVSAHAPIAECVLQRKVVFSDRHSSPSLALLDFLAADEIVLVPLLSAQSCLGVLAAAVPANISQHLKSQTTLLQAFGLYAGLALSRRRQADKQRAAQVALARQEQQAGFLKMAQRLSQQVEDPSDTENNAPTGTVDMCQAVTEMVPLLQESQLIPASVLISCEVAGRVARVNGSTEMIWQIVLILVRNACERMPSGGHILIDAGVLVQRGDGMFTILSVSDTGAGTARELQAQLYEPLRDRKNSDKQTLYLNHLGSLVDQMSGHLKVNTSALGTQFDILLPCAAPGRV